ncbi:hypothetical protein KJ564_15270 [bacterium]|nr:hypothetical protein [bacterium]MBU1882357.1 hypothetical protein [bacterium]
MDKKRFLICLAGGLIAGLVCAYGGNDKVAEDVRTMVFISVVLNRAFIGFVIGISAWKMHWALHGSLIGVLGTLPMSVPLIVTPEAGPNAFLIFTIAGLVWGVLIEVTASVVFKAKMAGV